ncbi:MAG: hypothetical protein KatS3mg110_2721 [Pirellulaceae bacterium]|nr:MAG: hypothetical protein KatS3mg110_2721 [Pirellulaceae bacterium]
MIDGRRNREGICEGTRTDVFQNYVTTTLGRFRPHPEKSARQSTPNYESCRFRKCFARFFAG